MHAMHMRAVEHTNRRGLCTHHAAWANHTENRWRVLSVLASIPGREAGPRLRRGVISPRAEASLYRTGEPLCLSQRVGVRQYPNARAGPHSVLR
jgi:hypothetical protein